MPERLRSLLAPQSVLVIYQGDQPAVARVAGSLPAVYLQANSTGRFAAPQNTYDLAVAFVDASSALTTIRQLCESKTAQAIIVPGQCPVEVADASLVLADSADALLLGPHAFGLQLPALGLNASNMPLAKPGNIALLSQSGSLTAAMADWAIDNHVGFSMIASCGSRGATSLTSLLDYCAIDPATRAIVLYLDDVGGSVRQTRRFMSALRAASSSKPVVILKPTGHGAATEIPTVTMAQSEAVLTSALARAGAVRVYFFIQLFSALKLLTAEKHPAGRRLAVLSNSGAAARLAADWGQRVKVEVTVIELAGHLAAAEQASAWSAQIAQVSASENFDALMFVLTPERSIAPSHIAQWAGMLAQSRKPALACVLGDAHARELRAIFEAAHIPALRTPESAVDAFGNLATFHYNQELLHQIPPPMAGKLGIDLRKARALIAQAQERSGYTLDGRNAFVLLRALGIGRTSTLHPREVDSPAALIDFRIEARTHPQFGPALFFGFGGAAGEFSTDQAIELFPLNRLLSQRLIARSAVQRVLNGLAHTELVQVQLQNLLLALSEALCELPALTDVVIDPLRYGAGELKILRAVLTIAPHGTTKAVAGQYGHMAIHPYPAALITSAQMKHGALHKKPYTLRPIRPEDAFPLQVFVRGLSSESRYMRFISHLRELSAPLLVRYTQIDYDRELALVATVPDQQLPDAEQIIGMAHWLRSSDESSAEYALAVADGFQRQGIGSTLMKALEQQARAKALTQLEGFVLAENSAMLELMHHLGYQSESYPDDPNLRRVFKTLT